LNRIWIIGGGRFGRNAATKLKRKFPDAELVVVDRDFEICRRMKHASFDALCMDGISFLSTCLSGTSSADWIIPAVPVHVVFLWIREQLLPAFQVEELPVPDFILSRLPNPMKGRGNEAYMSVADFICPDNCPEPSEICTFTQKPRPYSLFEHLENTGYDPFTPVVIRSRQLAPGVGGFTPEMLYSALEKVKKTGNSILLSSACRCHGVMNALSIKERKK
jgi:hypothetical protein